MQLTEAQLDALHRKEMQRVQQLADKLTRVEMNKLFLHEGQQNGTTVRSNTSNESRNTA